jgi:tetratricopeptide (TPR) repeat protein
MVNEGAQQYQQNRHPEALGCFMKAINKVAKRNKGSLRYSSTERSVLSVAWANSAAVLRARGLQTAGQEALQQALSLMPSDVGLHEDMSDLFRAKNDCLAAKSHFWAALHLQHGEVSSHDRSAILYKEGVCLTECDRTEEAQTVYKEAIALNPGMWQAQFNIGALAIMNRGNLAAPLAEKMFQSVIATQPTLADGHRGLAIATQLKADGAMQYNLAKTALYLEVSHDLAMRHADKVVKAHPKEVPPEMKGRSMPRDIMGAPMIVSGDAALMLPRLPRWQYHYDLAMVDMMQGYISSAVTKIERWKGSVFRQPEGMAGAPIQSFIHSCIPVHSPHLPQASLKARCHFVCCRSSRWKTH